MIGNKGSVSTQPIKEVRLWTNIYVNHVVISMTQKSEILIMVSHLELHLRIFLMTGFVRYAALEKMYL